jgi:hypothetical protein
MKCPETVRLDNVLVFIEDGWIVMDFDDYYQMMNEDEEHDHYLEFALNDR